MGYTVFYMNPRATAEVCQIIRQHMPEGWHVTLPGVNGEFHNALASCDFILVADQPILAEHIAAAPRLRMIQHQGVGYERIDLNACRSRGIPVALTPEGTSVGVAEHTLLLILAVYKNLIKASTALQSGSWLQWELRNTSFDLRGKSLGILGMGRIGREVAQRAVAFGAQIIYVDPLVEHVEGITVTRLPSLAALLGQSDVVSLHVPLTPENRHLINGQTLQMMKPSALLVNTARGGLVDEKALAEALESGRIAAAALDVLEHEPPRPDNPLLRLENVLITPHIAAGSRDTLVVKMCSAFANMLRHTRGESLTNVVPELADLSK